MRLNLGLDFKGPLVQTSRSRSFDQTIAQPLIGSQAQVGLGDAVGNRSQINLCWR